MVCPGCYWRGQFAPICLSGVILTGLHAFFGSVSFLVAECAGLSAHSPSQTCVTSSKFSAWSPCAFRGGALGFPVEGADFCPGGSLSFTFGGDVPWNVAMHMPEPTMFIGLDVHHGGDPWVMSFRLVFGL